MYDLGVTVYIESVEQVMTFYPELNKEDILKTWSMRKHRVLILMGFKFCKGCSILVRTPDLSCRCCTKRFTTRIRTRMAI